MTENGYTSLFNGKNLTGWFAAPRTYGEVFPGGPQMLDMMAGYFPADYNERSQENVAVWTVEDGAIVGRQNIPGGAYGGYLVSEKTYGDFELIVEAKPDWPADTGILLRKRADSWHGLQLLIDHRKSGTIGGYFGGGIGCFQAASYNTDAVFDETGRPIGLAGDRVEGSFEPFAPEKAQYLTYGATLEEFLSVWKWDDWNLFRIRVIGEKPIVTCWINGLKISEINLETLVARNYDAEDVARTLGRRGHIAFEVHDQDPQRPGFRWGDDAACRWRNIQIKEL